MKKLIAVGLLALLMGFVFCAAAARVYIDHDTVAIKSLLFSLVDAIVGVVLLRKAYVDRKEKMKEKMVAL